MNKTMFMAMTTHAVSEGENQKVFCKLAIREQWLNKAICGNKHRDSVSCGLQLFHDLHKIVHRIWTSRSPSGAAAAVAEAAAVSGDPMDDVAFGDDDDHPRKKRRRGVVAERPTRANPCKGKVFTCNCPSVPPEAFPSNKETRCISLLALDHQTIWLSIDDVDWALKYLYAQYMIKMDEVLPADGPGQHGVPAESAAPAAAESAAAPPAETEPADEAAA